MAPAPSGDSLPGITVLEQSPIIIEKILLDAPPDALQWKPAMDRWSISEVLAHLTDVEICFRERVMKMVKEDSPALLPYDQNAAYADGKYSSGLAREHLHHFCHERDRTLSALRYLPAAAAIRSGHHTVIGKITVGEHLNEWACHDLGHIRQIAELYRARMFFPRLGNFKQYYSLKP
jgi:hypothetical protein